VPLSLLSFLNYVTQAWKGKVKSKHQGLLAGSPTKKPTSGGFDLFMKEINGARAI
jgi:hypothetical protein